MESETAMICPESSNARRGLPGNWSIGPLVSVSFAHATVCTPPVGFAHVEPPNEPVAAVNGATTSPSGKTRNAFWMRS